MKKTYAISLAILFFAITHLQAQSTAKLIKKVEAQPGTLGIAYEKYKMPNGLTVIVAEDHSDPIVHVEMTYHVGSNRETPKRTGFAHFFEHMMFQGSQNVADEEHFKVIQTSGGSMNGTTNRDRTNYFQTVPSNMLETTLWLEADRMGFLLPAFTNKKFENQRSTVKNEKDQRYANGYGMLPEVQDQTIYPYGHPYSWQTIGYVDDLDAADSNDLKNFFLKWYGPNNAILVITGDVNTQEVLGMVEKYFNSIAKGVDVPILPKNPVTLEESKTTSVDSKITFPVSSITYPSVPTFHNDEAALDILSQLLSNGKNSVLYKRFVESGNSVQASCSNGTFEIAGEFNFVVATYPASMGGLSQLEIKNELTAALADFEIQGFSDEDLNRIKSELVANYYSYIETIASKASVLTQYEMLLPTRDFTLTDDIARYQKVTKADIMRVFNLYIKGRNHVTVNILQHPDLATNPKARIKPYESENPYKDAKPDKSAYQGLTYKLNVDIAGFDRSKKPTISNAKPAVVPVFYKKTMDNGIKLIGTKSAESPRVYITINFKGGHLFETGKVKNGTAAMLASIMTEGSATKTPLEIENILKDLGSEISFSSGNNAMSAQIECYKNKLTETMAVFEDLFYNPRFDEKEFKISKKATLQSITGNAYDASYHGQKNLNEMFFGTDNPIGILSLSDYKQASKISIEDLKFFHQNFLSPNLTTISIIGELDETAAIAGFAGLSKWQNKNLILPVYNQFPAQNTKPQIFMLSQEYAKQTDLTIAFRSIPSELFGDFLRASVMNYALGGNFNSRLNLNIREDKGWTYGIRSGFSTPKMGYPSVYFVSAGVKSNKTDSSIMEVMKELKNYRENGITDEEFSFTKRALLGSEALKYESPYSKLSFLSTINEYDLDRTYNDKRAEFITNITKEEVNAMAKKILTLDNMIIMCVGDDIIINDKLNQLGYGKVKVLKY